jgi:hypothetical protein
VLAKSDIVFAAVYEFNKINIVPNHVLRPLSLTPQADGFLSELVTESTKRIY